MALPYSLSMNRRSFLAGAAAAWLAPKTWASSRPTVPIIDTHIHLFDPARPQGVPWPTKQDKVLYRPALPDRYRRIAVPLGVVGAIVVEASPWLEDNQWVLDLAARNPLIVGFVGNLEPGSGEFRKHLDRFGGNPLFRGIRYGNLWDRDLGKELSKPEFVAGLRELARTGLSLDTANPTPALIASVVRATDLVPELRVILDHLPQLSQPTDAQALKLYRADLRRLGERRQVYIKVSEVLRHIGGRVPDDLKVYRPTLDELWDIFGPDRLLYGSDWPNSDTWAPYATELRVVRAYFNEKEVAAAEKFFWKNSIAAYRWVKRSPAQPEV